MRSAVINHSLNDMTHSNTTMWQQLPHWTEIIRTIITTTCITASTGVFRDQITSNEPIYWLICQYPLIFKYYCHCLSFEHQPKSIHLNIHHNSHFSVSKNLWINSVNSVLSASASKYLIIVSKMKQFSQPNLHVFSCAE